MTPCTNSRRSPMRTAVLLCIVAVTCLPVVSAKRVQGGSSASQKRKLLKGKIEPRPAQEFAVLQQENDNQVSAPWQRIKKGKGGAEADALAAADGTWMWKSKGCKSTKSPSRSTKSPSGSTKSPSGSTKSPSRSTTKSPSRSTKSPSRSATCDDDIPFDASTQPPDDGGPVEATVTLTPTTPDIDPVPNADICELIKNQDKPDNLKETRLLPFAGYLSIAYSTTVFTAPEDVAEVLEILKKPVALWVAGCEAEAEEYLESRRKLAGDEVDYAELSNFVAGDNCTSSESVEPNACIEFRSDLEVWSNVDATTLRQRLIDAFRLFTPQLLNIDGIENIDFDASAEGPAVAKTVAGSATAVERDEGLNAGGAVGVAAGCLALLLILALLVRRRQDSDEVSHLKLEEGEDTFIIELDSASQPSNEYNSRNAHVVGDEDSIFSGWSGYPDKDAFNDDLSKGIEGILGVRHGDVHVCASATCEACEKKRRQGLQFMSTGSPPGSPPRPVGLPSDAARAYAAEDTVEL